MMAKKFSPTERRILNCLSGPNTGKAVSHAELIGALLDFQRSRDGGGTWAYVNNIVPTNRQIGILRQVISRLRKKIETDPALPEIIITHRGQGYSYKESENE